MSRPAQIGVIGAGQMGRGIAYVSALSGFDTRLFDPDRAALKEALSGIEQTLEKGIQLGKISDAEKAKTLEHLTGVATVEQAVTDADLVIEAIPEDLSLKKDLFIRIAAVTPQETILASNTSSLSISQIASDVPNPERVVGMHFFNPPHIVKLLEVIRGDCSVEAVIGRVSQIGRQMGREVVVINDSPGFASSRLGIALGMEAIRMVEQGVASPADIDAAMVHGYRHPVGPLRLTDMVGLDIRLAITRYLHQTLGEPQFRPPQLLEDMVQNGLLGKKSGQGFYCWSK
ncbi:MAG: 3-hydroxyacyl-CoA dehydrogenase family protein [Arenicellales bacterium]|nr:3-hydroxyacyl-CoA dehydrogenase family protein [Arenicellales bacterium]